VLERPTAGGEARYGMLEPVRQYALEKLGHGEEAEEVLRKHAEFFLALAERAEPEMRGPDEPQWLELLEEEHDNFRAAFSWAVGTTGDAGVAARLCWALQVFFWVRGYQREGRRWIEETLERELRDDLRARALHVGAGMAYAQGDYPVAEGRYRAAARLSRREGDELLEGRVLAGLGLVQMTRQDHGSAKSSLERAIALLERRGAHWEASFSRVLLGSVLVAQGEEGAESLFREALAWVRAAKNPSLTVIALNGLARSALARHDFAEAGDLLEEAVGVAGQTGEKANLANLLESLATVRAHCGEAERSAVLLGAAEGLLEEVGARVYNQYAPDRSLYERTLSTAQSQLGEKGFREARERGRRMTFEQVVVYAPSEADALKEPRR
jgi:tetratricopeptide (TPR) repeat protein